ncbi:hypothetical protein [Stenotrophomonas maltophilia]|nr:hypothetical protein [Stenotrophomonas maltophilia]
MNFGYRRVFLCDFESFKRIENGINVKNCALLLPAFMASEVESSLSFALEAVRLGCKEVCCVGQFSDALEDALDAVLELNDRLEVVTTSSSEEGEALEYFLFGAGGGNPGMDLVAVVENHPALRRALVTLIR